MCVCAHNLHIYVCLRCLIYTYPFLFSFFHWRPLEKHFLCHCIRDTLSTKSFSLQNNRSESTPLKMQYRTHVHKRASKDAQTVKKDFVEGNYENYTLPIYMKKTEHHNQLLPLVLLWLLILLTHFFIQILFSICICLL